MFRPLPRKLKHLHGTRLAMLSSKLRLKLRQLHATLTHAAVNKYTARKKAGLGPGPVLGSSSRESTSSPTEPEPPSQDTSSPLAEEPKETDLD